MSNSNESSPASDLASTGAMALLGGAAGSLKEKWDGSKGQELMSTVSSSINQDTKDYLNEAKSKIFNPAYLRSPSVFFGIGEERGFFVEKQPGLLAERIKHNLTFFYLNYTLITAILFLFTLLTSRAIIGFVFMGLVWASFLKATAGGSLTIRGIEISQKKATMVMTGLSILFLIYLLENVFWWTISSSGFFVGIHALFRDASMHKDEEDRVEMLGEFGGEDAAFLNPVADEPESSV